MNKKIKQPLEDINILDLTRVLAGPTSTQILGDLGANIIKIERPLSGDDSRNLGPPYLDKNLKKPMESSYFLSVNRNKNSVELDFTKKEGQELAKKLIKKCDVLVENFRAGNLKQYGLDYKSIKKINPEIIYCSITGFGQNGPYSKRGGYDYLVQAMGGIMSITGEKKGNPTKIGVGVSDIITGLYSTIGILSALRFKEVTGKGKICRIVVDDPGNGFPRPPTGGTGDGEYPVTLELDGIEVINPGINHNCGVDRVVIEPSNGAQLSYQCDTFGRITNVNIVGPPPRGFTTTPDIRVITETGTNFQAVPRFRVVRDPVGVDVEPEQILQVTDLVGLKLTGYVEGRAYYGSVFFKDGVRYAGIYETPGQLIQVYDTLQESIDAEVTTPPSAIQRSGTDVRSNNPRLNIPGTPDSLT